jgi:hypothetical protein
LITVTCAIAVAHIRTETRTKLSNFNSHAPIQE